MARFLTVWRSNRMAPWPRDPQEYSNLSKKMWAGIDDLMKKGEIKEFGFFIDGRSGFVISEGDALTCLRNHSMFGAFYDFEVNEIIPYEQGKETMRAVMKAQAAQK